MCGIAGYFSLTTPIERHRLRAMRDALAHRGPDDAGETCWDAEGRLITDPDQPAHFALLHRRLSILDLSPAGHQPMASADGQAWIAFNGEIYNFRELKAELARTGVAFRSGSDTEVLLEMARRFGIESALPRAHGMFALAYFEPATRRLWLARDRLGKKPLYYTIPNRSNTIVFASEIKALHASGLPDLGELDPVGFDRFWTRGVTGGEGTIHARIHQVPPGGILDHDLGSCWGRSYWRIPMARSGAEGPDRTLDEAANELEFLLLDAVKSRLVSDVPVGLFLSGGVDSALVCALAAKAGRSDLRAFTVAFRDHAHDESGHAARIARHLGLPHEILPVDETQAPDFARIARQFDQPFGDVSCIPTYFLCRAARDRVTVALTGDGGDEAFAGYHHYREGLRLWGGRGSFHDSSAAARQRRGLKDSFYSMLGARRGYPLWARHFNLRQKSRFYSKLALARTRLGTLGGAGVDTSGLVGDSLSIMQAIDIATYLPDDILVKMDRMSMAVGLEARSPLLDHRVIEFAATLPLELKVDEQGRGKRILRHLLARHVPRELWDRPKTGFTPPWADWYLGMKDDLRRRWSALPDDWINPSAADYVFPDGKDRFSLLTWNFYSWLVFQESLAGNGA